MSDERVRAGDERVRLFVALSLPLAVRDALAGWRDHVLPVVAGLRPVSSEALHVTLCFLGWRSMLEVEAIGAACRGLGPLDAARLTVGDPVWLPARRPRVLGVSLDDAGGQLARVQAELSRELSAGGWYAPEARPFLAHVTVARVRKDARVRVAELATPPRVEFDGADVTLFRSRLAAAGARYEPLASVMLAPAGERLDPGAVGGAVGDRSTGGAVGKTIDALSVVRRFYV